MGSLRSIRREAVQELKAPPIWFDPWETVCKTLEEFGVDSHPRDVRNGCLWIMFSPLIVYLEITPERNHLLFRILVRERVQGTVTRADQWIPVNDVSRYVLEQTTREWMEKWVR